MLVWSAPCINLLALSPRKDIPIQRCFCAAGCWIYNYVSPPCHLNVSACWRKLFMNSMTTENLVKTAGLLPEVGQQTLTYWPALQPDEQAFVAAYVENSYSVPEACTALKISRGTGAKMLKNVTIRKAISEVQETLDGIDFLNERWVKAQLLRIFPMAMGDEPVPMVTATGEEIEARKFYPDVAMKIVEYVAPKAQKASVNISINNIGRLSDAELERIAMSGGRIVSEQ